MSASTTSSHSEAGSFWPVANIVIGWTIAGFTAIWGLAMLAGALGHSFGSKEATLTEAASTISAGASAPAAPLPGPLPADASNPAPVGADAGSAQAGTVFELTMKPAGPAGMEYDVKAFTVKAGQKVKITFENTHPIPQPHNIVFGKPNTKDKIMMAAMQMAADPAGMAKGYVPEGDDVLHHTKLLQPTQSEVLEFDAPAEPGLYPYLCTFPGHAILMNGVMTVE